MTRLGLHRIRSAGALVAACAVLALAACVGSGVPSAPPVLTASVGPAFVAPSPSPESSPSTSADAVASGGVPPAFGDCGRIPPAACAQAIELARAGHEADLVGTTRIVVDDTCPPEALCDRKYPVDSIAVFVTAGGDTTGWYAFHVFGRDAMVPTKAERWRGEIPAHVVARLRQPQPSS